MTLIGCRNFLYNVTQACQEAESRVALSSIAGSPDIIDHATSWKVRPPYIAKYIPHIMQANTWPRFYLSRGVTVVLITGDNCL